MRLAAHLAVTFAFLLAVLPACAQTPGKVPHIGYVWIGVEGSDRATRPGLQKGLRDFSSGSWLMRQRLAAIWVANSPVRSRMGISPSLMSPPAGDQILKGGEKLQIFFASKIVNEPLSTT